MLKLFLNNDLTISNIMIGIIIILGVIVFYKFSKYLFNNVFFQKSVDEPVLKNLIKKPDDIQPLNQ